MKFIIIFFTILTSHGLFGQVVVETIPKIYFSDSDTIKYKYSDSGAIYELVLNKNDTISPGTATAKDIIMTAFIGKDTLTVSADNFPYSRKSIVTIQTPDNGKSVVIFRFNGVTASFSNKYIKENNRKIRIEVPEVYELVNILWLLSPSGKRAKNLYKPSEYYDELQSYFKPFLDHPIFEKLNFDENEYDENYYDFRENSFCFIFDDSNRIVSNDTYFYVIGNDWENYNSLFKQLIPLIEDFALKSGYRKFYALHKKYYQNQIERMKSLLPLKNMWNWLENEFPDRKINAYKIVFSPLIGSSHSTQRFSFFIKKPDELFTETVMFVSGPERYDSGEKLTEKQKEGLLSGMVFTEIDHNYVNPESRKYEQEINEIFGKRHFWSSDNEQFYKNPIAVFNEYMTHAVFCLWVQENYDEKTSRFIIEEREKLNVENRKFYKFREFNRALMRLRELNPHLKAAELYPLIMEWCHKIK